MTIQFPRCLFQALLATLAALVIAAPAAADPPGRVGRIAWMSGTVQLRNADTGEWNAAVLNYPLTNGDALSTGPGARLEVSIGSTKVRLDSSSELSIDQLDDERVRLYLTSGSATVRLRSRESAREFELATRDGRFTTQDVGAFRFDYGQNVTTATTYLGTLHFEAEDSELDIANGQRAQFWYSGRTAYSLSSPVRDDFSEWSMARDQSQDTRSTRRYVSQEMTGYEDLAEHGDWYDSVDYGPIWYPTVVATGWAPYRTGHWAWVAPWGWTWIDDASWGFAPFHYGRWVWHRNRWGWAPGRVVVRPVYAPALVAWVGTPHLSVTVTGGPAVGWFPLAPREVYVPSYRCSPTYVRNVNITHVTHIENVTQIINEPQRVMEHTRFANRNLAQAVTVVPAEVVTQRRPVAPAVEHPRNPRWLETVKQQAPLAQAPVGSPPLPPRVDPDRRGRGEPPRERRADGDWRTRERRAERGSATPLPPPLNANSVQGVAPQTPAPKPGERGPEPPKGQPPRAEPRRGQEPASSDAPLWNRPGAVKPAPVPPSAAPQPPASPPARPDDQRQRKDAARGEQPRATETPWADAPRSRRAEPAPAAIPQPPGATPTPVSPPPRPDQRPHRESPRESPRAEPQRAPESPWGDGPRVSRPTAPAPVAAPPARPAEPPRAAQPVSPQRHSEPPPARPKEPAAMPAPAQRNTSEREWHSPPPAARPQVRQEAPPAAPPPQRSQPMPPREAPAQAQQPQNPRHQAERGQGPAWSQGNQGGQQPQGKPHRRDDDRDNR